MKILNDKGLLYREVEIEHIHLGKDIKQQLKHLTNKDTFRSICFLGLDLVGDEKDLKELNESGKLD